MFRELIWDYILIASGGVGVGVCIGQLICKSCGVN